MDLTWTTWLDPTQTSIHDVEGAIDVILDDVNLTWFCEHEPQLQWLVTLSQGIARLNTQPTGKVVVEFASAPWQWVIARDGAQAKLWLIRTHPTLEFALDQISIPYKAISRAVYQLIQTWCQTLTKHNFSPAPVQARLPRPEHHQTKHEVSTLHLQHQRWHITATLAPWFQWEDPKHPQDIHMLLYQGQLLFNGQRQDKGHPIWTLIQALHHEDSAPDLIDFAQRTLRQLTSLIPQMASHPWITRARQTTTHTIASAPPASSTTPPANEQPHFPWSLQNTLALYPSTTWTWSGQIQQTWARHGAILTADAKTIRRHHPEQGHILWQHEHNADDIHAIDNHLLLEHPDHWTWLDLHTGQAHQQPNPNARLETDHAHWFAWTSNTIKAYEHQTQLWAQDIPTTTSEVHLTHHVVTMTQEDQLVLLDMQTGETLMRAPHHGQWLTSAQTANNTFVLTHADDHLWYTSSEQPHCPQLLTAGRPLQTALCTPQHTLIVYATTGFPVLRLLCMENTTGDTLWTHTLQGPPRHAPPRLAYDSSGIWIHQPTGDLTHLDWRGQRLWHVHRDGLSTHHQPLQPQWIQDAAFWIGQSIELRQKDTGKLLHSPTQLIQPPSAAHIVAPMGLIIVEQEGASDDAEDLLYRLDFSHYLAVVS